MLQHLVRARRRLRALVIPVVAFAAPALPHVAHATWTMEYPDLRFRTGYRTHLAIDSSGVEHISYNRNGPYELYYATRTGTNAWTTELVDNTGATGESFYNSLAFDRDGVAHIAYYGGDTRLKYATRSAAGTWSIVTVDQTLKTGKTPSLQFSSDNRAFIAYYDETHYDLRLAVQNGTSWTISAVDTNGVVGWDTSLQLDANNVAHIAYHSPLTGQLRYVEAGQGVLDIVEEPGPKPALYNTSLALDAQGNPRISYLYANTLDLHYAVRTAPGVWAITAIDTLGETGGHTSLAIDRNGVSHIAYHDRTAFIVEYATQKLDGSWRIETADAVDSVGEFNTLVLDKDQNPHIAYHDQQLNNLKYVFNPTWTTAARVEPSLAPEAQVWPSPFRREVRVSFAVRSVPTHVDVDVYDATGRRRGRVWSGLLQPGTQSVAWNGEIGGRPVPPGTYWLRVHGGNVTLNARVVRTD